MCTIGPIKFGDLKQRLRFTNSLTSIAGCNVDRMMLDTRIVGTTFIFALFLMVQNAALSFAKELSATLNADVAAGKIYSARLGNLSKDATVAITIVSDGQVTVTMIDQERFDKVPTGIRPLFSGQTNDKLSFKIRVPKSGNYYLLLDNRTGRDDRSVMLTIRASTTGQVVPTRKFTEQFSQKLKQAHAQFEKFEVGLRKYFVFGDLDIRLRSCGQANATTLRNLVVICAELAPLLLRHLKDKKKAQDALIFSMVHELGHVLLKQWKYPFYDNEEIADEFATVLMVMFGQGHRVRSPIEFFLSIKPGQESEFKHRRFNRHPLSVQRARNLKRWLEDQSLVRRWQPILVPNMQTPVLKALMRRPKNWTDIEVVKNELVRRGR